MNPHRIPAGRIYIIRHLATRTGLWCDTCNLPSGLAVRYGWIDAANGAMGLDVTVRRCRDCGAVLNEETP